MAKQISIICKVRAQDHAAKALSSALNKLKRNHLINGRFALHLLGSSRHTNDVNMMIDIISNMIHDFLCLWLRCINQHFVQLALKLYHVLKLIKGLAERELVLINEENVLIETLSTNTLELLSEINPAMILYIGKEEKSSSELNVLIFPKAQKYWS